MFNPYYARPIGSLAFENHLLNLMIEGIETERAAKEAIPEYKVSPIAAKKETSFVDPVMEGYKALNTAIFSLAVLDYLTEYEKRLMAERESDVDPRVLVHTSRCLQLENDYFRQDEDRAAVLDYILKNVIHCSTKINRRLDAIRDLKAKISRTAGWSGGR